MKEWKPLAKRFIFERFDIEPENGRIAFVYTTDAGHSFTHELSYDFPKNVNVQELIPAAFALGMAELAHFWKATLAPEILVKAGALSKDQIAFWENLYTKGLGEFFYVNQIDFRGLIQIASAPKVPEIRPAGGTRAPNRALVPFGGGKDSLVTGEMLKKQEKGFSWFELEPLPFGKKLREISGVTTCVSMGRNVARNFASIMDLVRQGAPNGHVPITATYMFSAAFVAQAEGFSDIVMSLERSADVGNVEYLGQMVNHQYSKSLEFEIMAAEYIRTYINPDLRLFSLLRPLYEIQIAQEFAKHSEYFSSFISCNRGLKTGTWCGECAKCAFMFAALSAFLPPQTVVGIFKKNLFEDTLLLPLYTDMIGLGSMKPFDCVGTFEENLLALFLSGEQYKKVGMSLPAILMQLPIAKGGEHTGLLTERGDHRIPKEYRYE